MDANILFLLVAGLVGIGVIYIAIKIVIGPNLKEYIFSDNQTFISYLDIGSDITRNTGYPPVIGTYSEEDAIILLKSNPYSYLTKLIDNCSGGYNQLDEDALYLGVEDSNILESTLQYQKIYLLMEKDIQDGKYDITGFDDESLFYKWFTGRYPSLFDNYYNEEINEKENKASPAFDEVKSILTNRLCFAVFSPDEITTIYNGARGFQNTSFNKELQIKNEEAVG